MNFVASLDFTPQFELHKKGSSWQKFEDMRVLISPTRNEVLKVAAKMYLDRLGARRLIALDYRASEKGDWAEREDRFNTTVNISPAGKVEELVKVPSIRKLENSYFFASLVAKGRGDQSTAEKAIKRLSEFQNLLPSNLAEYGEAQLSEYASRMIEYY